MLTRRAPLVALIVMLIAIGTSGCFASAPAPSPSVAAASPSPSPLFASDEEALAAATDAYAAYQAASNSIGKAGWKSFDQLKPLMTDEAAADEIAVGERYQARGLVQLGDSTFDSVSVQSVESDNVSAYLCVDASAADVIDANGISVVDRDQPRRLPLEIEFTASPAQASKLLVGRSAVWEGENFC